ncbi:hypothetical protein AMECASPLE_030063 [Ameca splendens]|uniref:Uncharacterized protein n=1 Tax=Ameca splendens TaxID=208324 RepID=A0ABV1A1E0_9TELE
MSENPAQTEQVNENSFEGEDEEQVVQIQSQTVLVSQGNQEDNFVEEQSQCLLKSQQRKTNTDDVEDMGNSFLEKGKKLSVLLALKSEMTQEWKIQECVWN